MKKDEPYKKRMERCEYRHLFNTVKDLDKNCQLQDISLFAYEDYDRDRSERNTGDDY